MATPIQRCNSDIKLSRNRKERKMGAIHGCTLTYPKPCFKVVKKFNNDITFVWYRGSSSYTLKVPKYCSRKFQGYQ